MQDQITDRGRLEGNFPILGKVLLSSHWATYKELAILGPIQTNFLCEVEKAFVTAQRYLQESLNKDIQEWFK